jgi:deazaflavin-dependent oxidoreductase (nitroreductase family)
LDAIVILPGVRPSRASDFSFAAAGPVRRRVRLLVTTGPVAAVSARVLPSLDRQAFRLTGGRFTPSAWVTGLPVIELETTGARSGVPRAARVLGVPVAEGHLVVAANFGATSHPAWYFNLRRHPSATAAGEPVVAEELHGPDREAGFELAASLNPGWRRFAERAGDRAIPVMLLRRGHGR